MNFAILGSGSWGTALAKILTDNGNTIYWWHRSDTAIKHIETRHHNLHYLPSAQLDVEKIKLSTNLNEVIQNADCIIIAVPSAYVIDILKPADKKIFEGKKIISAIKGIRSGKLFCLAWPLPCRRSSSRKIILPDIFGY
jgi:glycerol-3-phosphate dehydrogenase (NAD(P)+)